LKVGMRRAIFAVYIELSEDRLYYRKHNGIAQCCLEHVLQRYVEAKSICLKSDAHALN